MSAFPAASAARPRVLVADDSAFMRRLLSQTLRDAGFDVVGEAADGDQALSMFSALHPDAMTLDLAMPGLNGIGVLRRLRTDRTLRAVPVVVVSAFSPAQGARAVEALAEGAFDLVAKPGVGEPLETFATELRAKVSAAATASGSPVARTPVKAPRTPVAPAPRRTRTTDRVVMIATSTGGPQALGELIPGLPGRLGAGGMIVQHMPAGFTASLAVRLDGLGKIGVVEAKGGEVLRPDTLLLAPGGHHLRIGPDRVMRLSDEPAIGGLRPRADLTIADAANLFGDRLLLVVMTGMGRDGLDGARVARAKGARIIAEHESSCTVYGMPRAIVDASLADEVVPLPELAAAIAAEVR